MKANRTAAFLLVLIAFIAIAFTGCADSNTVSGCIVSDRKYTDRNSLDSAIQPERLKAGLDVYASVYFIESPKGMEYTAKWFINGNEVKADTQKMPTDRKGLTVFSLEGDLVIAGALRFEVSYDGELLVSRELFIDEE